MSILDSLPNRYFLITVLPLLTSNAEMLDVTVRGLNEAQDVEGRHDVITVALHAFHAYSFIPFQFCQVERVASADCSRLGPDTDTRVSPADTARAKRPGRDCGTVV